MKNPSRDEEWLYCASCNRAIAQEECILDETEGGLRCPYDDCALGANLAFESLYGWSAYRKAHPDETAHWPQEPIAGERYGRRSGG